MRMTSITWRGALGTPVVLGAIAAVVAGQLAFTYLPLMHELFDSRPIDLVDGLLIIAIGVALMVVCEVEKALMRYLGLLQQLEA